MDNLKFDEEALEFHTGSAINCDTDGLSFEQLELFLADAIAIDSANAYCGELFEQSPLYGSSPSCSDSTKSTTLPASPPYSGSETHSPEAPVALDNSAWIANVQTSVKAHSDVVHISWYQPPGVAAAVPVVAYASKGYSDSASSDSSNVPGMETSVLSPLVSSSSIAATTASCGTNGSHERQKKRKLNSSQTVTPHAALSDEAADIAEDSGDGSTGSIGGGCGGSRTVKWHALNGSTWCRLADKNASLVNVATYHLDADKGINFSALDDSFISQKKNHFQVTCTLAFSSRPHFVVMENGSHSVIDGIYLRICGIKKESVNQIVKVEQSQVDRSKKQFDPMLVLLTDEHSAKITIGRLHFMETTNNNMRKKGKPNPDQRYFLLVVGLYADCQGVQHPIAEYASDRIIVRASNPGQFEGEPETLWQKGTLSDSIYHYGSVGINSDRPDEALVVNGNIKIMGRVVQPSDERIKTDITEVDSREQLSRLAQLRMYRYKFREEFGNVAGLSPDELEDTGVLAQQLSSVLPGAVHNAGDVMLSNGELIENLLVVNKDRLFMESVGAVKELCKVTEILESRVLQIEKNNQSRAAGSKRSPSLRSNASSSPASKDGALNKEQEALGNSDSLVYFKKAQSIDKAARCVVISRKALRNIVIGLVVVMTVCLAAIITLYTLDKGTVASTTKSSNASLNYVSGAAVMVTDSLNFTMCSVWPLLSAGCSATTPCPHYCGACLRSLTASGTTNLSSSTDNTVTTTTPKLLSADAALLKQTNVSLLALRKRRSARRRRASEWPDLFNMISLSLTDSKLKNIYNLTRDQCLSCDVVCSTDCTNYTIVLFVHDTFPLYDVVFLHFDLRLNNNTNLSIVNCGLATSDLNANNSCSGSDDTLLDLMAQLPPPQPSFPSSPPPPPSFLLPRTYTLPVGLFKSKRYKFRIGYGNILTAQNVCAMDLATFDFVEVNINVLRICDYCVDQVFSEARADLIYLQYLQIPDGPLGY